METVLSQLKRNSFLLIYRFVSKGEGPIKKKGKGGEEQGKQARTKSNPKACVIHKFSTGSVSQGQTYPGLLGKAKKHRFRCRVILVNL